MTPLQMTGHTMPHVPTKHDEAVLTSAQRVLARLGLNLAREGQDLRVEAREDFFAARDARSRMHGARRIIYALLDRLDAAWHLRIHGIPYCFMPGAHGFMLHPAGANSCRRMNICGACRFKTTCPGVPAARSAAPSPIRLEDGLRPISHALEEIAIEVTSACDLKCGICLIHKSRRREPSAVQVRRVIDEAAAAGVPTVRFTGGEPLLRKDLFELMDHAKQRGLTVYLNTNGTRVDARTISRLEKSVDSVLLSVQGHDPQSEQKLTGGGKRFLDKIEHLKALATSRIPSLRMDTILSRTLLRHRERYVSILRGAGVRHWILNRPMSAEGTTGPSDEYDLTPEEFRAALEFLAGLHAQGIAARVGNAVPFCVSADFNQSFLFHANAVTEGHCRLVYDCRGFYKPTYQIAINLGDDLARAQRHPFLRALRSLRRLPSGCSKCPHLKDCLGGNRYLAWRASGDYFSADPLMAENGAHQ